MRPVFSLKSSIAYSWPAIWSMYWIDARSMLTLEMSNTKGLPPSSGEAAFLAWISFFSPPSVRSEKLKRPSLPLTTRALTPETLTESTMYSPRSSGISLTAACADSRATNC
jgi:hypothetical protein